jgi:hypothetical protein
MAMPGHRLKSLRKNLQKMLRFFEDFAEFPKNISEVVFI